jgi:AraC-like DNA-binding protein
MVEIKEDITPEQREMLGKNLKKSGLELMDDKRSVLVEKIKLVVNEIIYYSDATQKENYSEFISRKTGYDYSMLSTVFSEVTGITTQHFIILNKIERVKELLIYDLLSITEIAFLMRYSSSAHLSNQFKKITGLTPAYYKQMARKRRQNLKNL